MLFNSFDNLILTFNLHLSDFSLAVKLMQSQSLQKTGETGSQQTRRSRQSPFSRLDSKGTWCERSLKPQNLVNTFIHRICVNSSAMVRLKSYVLSELIRFFFLLHCFIFENYVKLCLKYKKQKWSVCITFVY